MAALSACPLVRGMKELRHVVAVRPLYGCSDHLLGSGLLGTRVTWADPDGIAGAIGPDTGLVLQRPAESGARLVLHSATKGQALDQALDRALDWAKDRAMECVPVQERAGAAVQVTAGRGAGRGIRPGVRTAAGS